MFLEQSLNVKNYFFISNMFNLKICVYFCRLNKLLEYS